MSVTATAAVEIQTCPQDVPSLPAWLGEVTLLAHHLTRREVLDAICDQVHLARGCMGRYEVIDFLAVLFGYAISGERTLAAFLSGWPPLPVPLWPSLAASSSRIAPRSRAFLRRWIRPACKPCGRSSSRTASRTGSRRSR